MSDDYALLLYDEVLQETEDAVLFLIGDDEYWIPKSLMEEFDENRLYDTVLVQRWKIEELGLENFVD